MPLSEIAVYETEITIQSTLIVFVTYFLHIFICMELMFFKYYAINECVLV